MKMRYIIGGLFAAMMAPAFVSCSDSYLELTPETSISAETVNGSQEGAMAAATGLARSMQRQFSNLKNGNINFSGETYCNHLYGDALGPDDNVGEVTNYMTSGLKPQNFRMTGNGWWEIWMYRYCYYIINIANSILTNIEGNIDETNNPQMWVAASAFTYRAHAYTQLMRVYAPRWEDSNNGTKYCIVLRTRTGESNDKPFSTCNEVYDQIYSDLDNAIYYFEKAKNAATDAMSRGNDELYYVNEDVARGIYVRAALLKNDYKTAQTMAHNARQNYRIMTGDEYLEGFSVTNPEWMWAPAMDYLGVYYYNFGSHFACNGHYVISWGYSDSMQYDLYKNFKATDVRSQLYFGPLCIQHEPEMAEKWGITEEDFYDTANYRATSYGVSLTGSGKSPSGKNLAMWNFLKEYGTRFYPLRPADIKGIYLTNSKGLSFGIQYKFQGLDDGYTSCWTPYMRAAEMLLSEAEAAYQNGDNPTAVSCLTELMAQRDPEYKIPATSGQALLDEIKLQRRLEFFGEGMNWYDFKRWNQAFSFKGLSTNFEDMGSYPTALVQDFPTDFMMGWRAGIPQSEFTYNKAADPTDVDM